MHTQVATHRGWRDDSAFTQDLDDQMRAGRAFMNAWGLGHWPLYLERNVYEVGRTLSNPGQESIYLSLEFMRINSPLMNRNTLIHEVAHALTYKQDAAEGAITRQNTGHTRRWREMAIELGDPNPVEWYDLDNPGERRFPFTKGDTEDPLFQLGAMLHDETSQVLGPDPSLIVAEF